MVLSTFQLEGVSVHPVHGDPPNGPSKNLLQTRQPGFLEARSGVCVFRVPSFALAEEQEEHFCACCDTLKTLSTLITGNSRFPPQLVRISPLISAENGFSTLINGEKARNPH